jgi:hypothetical protein
VKTLTRRRKTQPAPPHIVFGALTHPRAARARPWLFLDDHEREPRVLRREDPNLVVWSSIWPERPTDRIVFTIEGGDIGYDSTLEWRLESDDDADEDRIRQMRRRLDELINRDLRLSFGQ